MVLRTTLNIIKGFIRIHKVWPKHVLVLPINYAVYCHGLKLTVDKLLLFVGGDAGQMSPLHSTLSLCCFPVSSMGEVLVAVTLKLVPAIATCFCIWWDRKAEGISKPEKNSFTTDQQTLSIMTFSNHKLFSWYFNLLSIYLATVGFITSSNLLYLQ